jgi:hypothetical protein
MALSSSMPLRRQADVVLFSYGQLPQGIFQRGYGAASNAFSQLLEFFRGQFFVEPRLGHEAG